MINETFIENYEEFHPLYVDSIVQFARELYKSHHNRPIRILDLATGPNEENAQTIRRLTSEGIDFEIVLSDISPVAFRIGYENLKRELTEDELKKVRCVLADARDLRKELDKVSLWEEGTSTIDNVLEDPRYDFLKTGYQMNERLESFEDDSFDLVIGVIPYSSIPDGYDRAIKESARVLRKGGYHVVTGREVSEINPDIDRTPEALRGAKIKQIEESRKLLDAVLSPIQVLSTTHLYNNRDESPGQTVQYGDVIKDSILIYRKVGI